jgi:SAM-dependent methyltransferase
VTAIDWSHGMVDEARRRVAAAGLIDRVDVLHVGIHELDRLAPVQFDAAYSNFGPLNCVDDLAGAAQLIAGRLRPGGILVASMIGRVCPWEIALYLARGPWRRAAVRFRRDPVPVPLEGRTVWTRYHTPAEVEHTFAAAGFTRASLRTLGLFAPPPYLEAFASRHPHLGLGAAAPRGSGRRLAGDPCVGRSLSDCAAKGMMAVDDWMPRLACPECRIDLGEPADGPCGVRGVRSRLRAPRRRLALPDRDAPRAAGSVRPPVSRRP